MAMIKKLNSGFQRFKCAANRSQVQHERDVANGVLTPSSLLRNNDGVNHTAEQSGGSPETTLSASEVPRISGTTASSTESSPVSAASSLPCPAATQSGSSFSAPTMRSRITRLHQSLTQTEDVAPTPLSTSVPASELEEMLDDAQRRQDHHSSPGRGRRASSSRRRSAGAAGSDSPPAGGRRPNVADHMNIPATRPGKPTELHRLVQSRDWDTLRARLGLVGHSSAPIPGVESSDAGKSNDADSGRSMESFDDDEDDDGCDDGIHRAVFSEQPLSSSLMSTNAHRPIRNANPIAKLRQTFTSVSSRSVTSSLLHPTATLSHSPALPPIKRSHCTARDEHGCTPLHLILHRYTAGSIRKRNLRLRRAPDDVILGLIDYEPLAASIPDEDGSFPVQYAAREGHGVGVLGRLIKLYPGAVREGHHVGAAAVAERGSNNGGESTGGGGGSALELAFEYVSQVLQTERYAGGTNTTATANNEWEGGDVDEQTARQRRMTEANVNEARWAAVKLLLSSGAPVPLPSAAAATDGTKEPPLLLRALVGDAPPDLIDLLIPPTASHFRSRDGTGDACTALYLAIARSYPLSTLRSLTSVCPEGTEAVRDETGMGLVSAQYVVWRYAQGAGGRWNEIVEHRTLMENASKSGTLDDARDEFKEWWEKMKFWLDYCRVGMAREGPRTGDEDDLGRRGDQYLLHSALSNGDAPPPVVKLLLAFNGSVQEEGGWSSAASLSLPTGSGPMLPLHIAAATPSYTPRHYENETKTTTTNSFAAAQPESTLELLLSAHPSAVKIMCGDKLPLHYGIESQKTYPELRPLVITEKRALRVRDPKTNLYPFQMASLRRRRRHSLTGESWNMRFGHVTRNKYSHSDWRSLSQEDRDRALEMVKTDANLDRLTLAFELLRSDSGLVASGIVHRDILPLVPMTATAIHPDQPHHHLPMAVAVVASEAAPQEAAAQTEDDSHLEELRRKNEELLRKSQALERENARLRGLVTSTNRPPPPRALPGVGAGGSGVGSGAGDDSHPVISCASVASSASDVTASSMGGDASSRLRTPREFIQFSASALDNEAQQQSLGGAGNANGTEGQTPSSSTKRTGEGHRESIGDYSSPSKAFFPRSRPPLSGGRSVGSSVDTPRGAASVATTSPADSATNPPPVASSPFGMLFPSPPHPARRTSGKGPSLPPLHPSAAASATLPPISATVDDDAWNLTAWPDAMEEGTSNGKEADDQKALVPPDGKRKEAGTPTRWWNVASPFGSKAGHKVSSSEGDDVDDDDEKDDPNGWFDSLNWQTNGTMLFQSNNDEALPQSSSDTSPNPFDDFDDMMSGADSRNVTEVSVERADGSGTTKIPQLSVLADSKGPGGASADNEMLVPPSATKCSEGADTDACDESSAVDRATVQEDGKVDSAKVSGNASGEWSKCQEDRPPNAATALNAEGTVEKPMGSNKEQFMRILESIRRVPPSVVECPSGDGDEVGGTDDDGGASLDLSHELNASALTDEPESPLASLRDSAGLEEGESHREDGVDTRRRSPVADNNPGTPQRKGGAKDSSYDLQSYHPMPDCEAEAEPISECATPVADNDPSGLKRKCKDEDQDSSGMGQSLTKVDAGGEVADVDVAKLVDVFESISPAHSKPLTPTQSTPLRKVLSSERDVSLSPMFVKSQKSAVDGTGVGQEEHGKPSAPSPSAPSTPTSNEEEVGESKRFDGMTLSSTAAEI